jgi:hypothetical protein
MLRLVVWVGYRPDQREDRIHCRSRERLRRRISLKQRWGGLIHPGIRTLRRKHHRNQ